MEKIKAWIAPLIVGVIVGAILLATVGGFVSGGTSAERVAEARQEGAEQAYISIFTPQCVENAQGDETNLAALREETSSWRQRNVVKDAGWAIYPEDAGDALERAIQEACAEALDG